MKKISEKYFQVIEFDEIKADEIDKKYFNELEEIAKYSDFMAFTKKGVLKTQNYVGIIQTKSGFVLEILPKIANEDNYEASKKILIKMIKTLRNHPFKNISTANLKIEKMPLFEIFISFFLNEVENVIKKGLKKDYVLIEENQNFLKGKLKFSEHIRKNLIHKERFYVEYDEFIEDTIENRILKAALLTLSKISKNFENKKRIRKFLFVFDGVKNLKTLRKMNINRLTKYYENALKIAEIFLKNSSFSTYKGENENFALLFDMNRLFESYVGEWFRKNFENIKLQEKRYNLFENENKFSLKPDIVKDEKIILDTKWKKITNKNDISQSDLYQMYAYITKYGVDKGYLIYPLIEFNENIEFTIRFCEKEAKVKIVFCDLTEMYNKSSPSEIFSPLLSFF